jgi:hypothetical protein
MWIDRKEAEYPINDPEIQGFVGILIRISGFFGIFGTAGTADCVL